jgi:hypothetical protein
MQSRPQGHVKTSRVITESSSVWLVNSGLNHHPAQVLLTFDVSPARIDLGINGSQRFTVMISNG